MISLLELLNKPTKKLRVFDFDDTLVKTDSYIYLTKADRSQVTMTPGEYALYEPQEGDQFDFSDFEKVINPRQIPNVFKLLKTILHSPGDRKVAILTARAAKDPIIKYLGTKGINNIEVVAVAGTDPLLKANWIENQIKQGYNDIFFIDDSHKNIKAVADLKRKYPNVSFKLTHIKH